MAQAASSGLVAALKASLADADAGWMVVSVNAGTVAGSLAVGTTSVMQSMLGGLPGTPPMEQTMATVVNSISQVMHNITDIMLIAQSYRVSDGGSAPLAIAYRSIRNASNAYVQSEITCDGAQFIAVDAALDASVRAKMTAFLNSRDASLQAALGAGPVSPADDPMLLPVALRTALLVSLEDDNAHWEARLASRHQPMTPISAVETRVTVSVSSPISEDGYVRLASGSRAPASFSYEASIASSGDVLDAVIRIDSAQWRTGADKELHDAVMALADAFVEAQGPALLAAIGAGPQ